MKTNSYILLILFALQLFTVPSQAVEVRGLYQAEVDVADQSEAARKSGLTEAMGRVLVKVSGLSTAASDDAVQDALRHAERYVRQFRYRVEERAVEPQMADEETEAGVNDLQDSSMEPETVRQLVLSVKFDPARVDRLLHSYQLPVWGEARPLTLIWLSVEQGGERLLVGADDQGLAREVIEERAAERALPIALPLLDLTDQQAISTADIWGGFEQRILDASERYEPQAVLIGKLYQQEQQWRAEWNLLQGPNSGTWASQGEDVVAVLGSGVSGTTDVLALRMSRNLAEQSGELTIEVNRVDTMAKFQRVITYLNSMNGVSDVRVKRVTKDKVRLHLEAAGGVEALNQMVKLGSTLELSPQQEQQPEQSSDSGTVQFEPLQALPQLTQGGELEVSPMFALGELGTPRVVQFRLLAQ